MATTAVSKLKDKLNLAQVIVGGLEAEKKAKEADPGFRKSDRLYYEAMAQYYKNIGSAREMGKKLVTHVFISPVEILYAMDVVPMSAEVSSDMAMAYTQGVDVREFRDAATAYGLPVEICGAHSATAGIALLGLMPKADMVVWSPQICDNTAKSGNDLAKIYNCPAYYLDHPYRNTQREIDYYIKELQGLVSFLEEHTKRKMDYKHLQEVVNLSEEAIRLWRDIYELKKAVPFPSRNMDVYQNFMFTSLIRGTPEAVEYFKASKAEIEGLVKAKKGAVPNERHRVLIITFIPSYALELLGWMEEKFGAVMVMDPISSWSYWEEYETTDPYEILAKRSFTMPGNRQLEGPFEWSIEDLIINAREFKIDSAISFNHLGCRQICALTKTLKDTLEENFNIPMLVIDCDAYDPTSAPMDEVKEKIEGYFEMIEG